MPKVKMLMSTFSAEYGRLTEGETYAVSDEVAQHWANQGLAEAAEDDDSKTAITRDKAKQPAAEKT